MPIFEGKNLFLKLNTQYLKVYLIQNVRAPFRKRFYE